MQRRSGNDTAPLQDRLASFAEELKVKASQLRPGGGRQSRKAAAWIEKVVPVAPCRITICRISHSE